MSIRSLGLAGLLLLAGCATASGTGAGGSEAALERALDGRVAGQPVDCIRLGDHLSTEIVERTAIIWNEGQTLYVNRTEGGAQALDRSSSLVTRALGQRLCSGDTINLVDPLSGIPAGVVRLGPFVPYRRSAAAER